MRTLSNFQRKRAKHLLHNGDMSYFTERSAIMRWALRKWGRTATFDRTYARFLRIDAMKLGYSVEVTRLRIKVWRWTWETWAWRLAVPTAINTKEN